MPNVLHHCVKIKSQSSPIAAYISLNRISEDFRTHYKRKEPPPHEPQQKIIDIPIAYSGSELWKPGKKKTLDLTFHKLLTSSSLLQHLTMFWHCGK
jgi:hypothetical protein